MHIRFTHTEQVFKLLGPWEFVGGPADGERLLMLDVLKVKTVQVPDGRGGCYAYRVCPEDRTLR